MKTALVSALLATTACLPTSFASAQDGWHLKNATTIDGKASAWDYVSFDEGTNHVFLGHRKEGLQVFDPVTHRVVKVIDRDRRS